MRSTLRKLFTVSALVAAAALATIPATAQNRFDVPFSFTVNGKACPPGHYLLLRSDSGDVVSLVSVSNSQKYAWILMPGNAGPDDPRVLVNFDQFGDKYALQSIQYEGLETATIDRKERRFEYAKNKDSHTVQIAMAR